MSEFVTTGSNNTVQGNEVNIRIKISQSGKYFTLPGKLIIANVSNIIDMTKANEPVQFQKENDANSSKFLFNNKTEKYFYETDATFRSFEIIIKGTKNPSFQNFGSIEVKIPVAEDTFETINFKVDAQEKTIVLKKITTNNHFVQQGKHKLILEYEIEGDCEHITLFENSKILKTDLKNQPIEIKFEDTKLSGLYEYTLQATKGTQMVSKSLTIVYVQKSDIKKRLKPIDWKIVNFCAAQNGDYFFALISDADDKHFRIGHTDQIDGSESWSTINITDHEKMKLFVSSPMLHLQLDTEKNEGKLGKLLFIGGSMIANITKAQDAGNQVAIIDLGSEDKNITLYPLPTYVVGHSCVLFPDDTNPNIIWLLGGQDEYGEPSNKIWTSADGINWTEKQSTIPFEARVIPSVSVSWKYIRNANNNEKQFIKDAIWLAGGFKEFDASGTVKADVWKYQGNTWTKIEVKALDVEMKNSKAFGLAYGGGVEETGHTGLYLLRSNESEEKSFGLKMDNQDNYILSEKDIKVEFKHYNQGGYITAFFRECLWVMGLYYKGASGIDYSDCYYRIPTIHQNTINFYNK